MRGLGIGVVIVAHFSAGLSEWAKTRLFGLSLIIDLFFILSGFLITTLLFEEWSKSGTISMRNFYVRRGLRLLPALAVVLAFVAFLPLFTDLPGKRTAVEIITAMLYVYPAALIHYQGKGGTFLDHLWTLSVEEWFYFGWPAFLAFVGLRPGTSRALRLMVGMLSAFVIGCFAIRAIGSLDGISRLIYALRPDSLFWGSLLAIFVRKLPDLRTPTVDRALSIIGPLGAVGFWYFLLAVYPRPAGIDDEMFHNLAFRSWNYRLGILCAVIHVGWLVLRPKSVAARFLSLRTLVYVGQLSYALYLWHQVLFRLYVEHLSVQPHRSLAERWTVALSIAAITVVVAMLSRRFVERPALRLKKRFETVKIPGNS